LTLTLRRLLRLWRLSSLLRRATLPPSRSQHLTLLLPSPSPCVSLRLARRLQ
jgi:hypothetical protein